MKTKQRIVRTYPVQVGKMIRALSSGPMTWDELRAATGIAAWLLGFVVARLEEEGTVDHGYPEDPRDSVVARYWLKSDPPGYPAWLEKEDDASDPDEVTFEDAEHDLEESDEHVDDE